ncbi:LIVCS family branched-chain amino acid:cation transporter [Cytobacillus oceanisediminis]|uniref:Branched-chain amino acid transport system carrier protein n=1 Tax=Cytobacillus oceanisediminis TaxID=665099 RepID=A0A2V3A3S9_9BACI|nr:branched-chain amino acid transport system II carrier protein [Cytobacillus oceanisediminis]PWW28194.1 LIVCS family branched-chain amino acid:cation transporter [Cytobacillus oceanisediminis]
MSSKIPFSYLVAVGFMLFALFFGAGNLIFPAMLGQSAGINIWSANAGFIITGVGLPLLGILALGFSGKSDLQSLAGRVHPLFGLGFTVALYLSIGPLFAIPRTATVSFEIGIKPYFSEGSSVIGLIIFSILFFGITVYFSLKSSSIVDIIGKFLTPMLLIVIAVLIGAAFINPMGSFQAPSENYVSGAFFKGFQEGYLTMDALAAFVFGIIVVNAVKDKGAATKKDIMVAIAKAGVIAAGLLAIIYTSLSFIGASSVSELGLLDNGGAVLSGASTHYFGSFGAILLSLIVFGACLTTSIGLITACSSYFNKLMPGISYKSFVIVLSIFSAVLANFGLSQLIAISVPVLVGIYPLAIALMALTFLHPLFKGKKEVYQGSMLFTFVVSMFDGLNAAGISFAPINELFGSILPLYDVGLGWIVPAIAGGLIGYAVGLLKSSTSQSSEAEKAA